MPTLPDAGDLVPYRMLKSVVEHTGCYNLPFLEIQDLFVVGRVKLVLFLRDPLVDHFFHLSHRVGQIGDDNGSRRYLRFQLLNLSAGF